MPQRFLDSLRVNPLVGILRGLPLSQVEACAVACQAAGLSCIEIPLNTPGAAESLAALRAVCAPLGLTVGAGTVRTRGDLQTALEAGAQFIVSPNTLEAVVRSCVERGLPCFPGALTPTEVEYAWRLGATAVKVFPIGAMGGVQYVKELRGPFRDIPLLACGGVNTSNAADYLRAGCDLLAFGGSIFSMARMEAGAWAQIQSDIKQLREAALGSKSV